MVVWSSSLVVCIIVDDCSVVEVAVVVVDVAVDEVAVVVVASDVVVVVSPASVVDS